MRRAHVQRLIPYTLPLLVLEFYRVVAKFFFSKWKSVDGISDKPKIVPKFNLIKKTLGLLFENKIITVEKEKHSNPFLKNVRKN